MKSELPLHKQNKSCPKCGNTFVSRRYNGARDVLERKCNGCGFDWHERPLDSATKDELISTLQEHR